MEYWINTKKIEWSSDRISTRCFRVHLGIIRKSNKNRASLYSGSNLWSLKDITSAYFVQIAREKIILITY